MNSIIMMTFFNLDCHHRCCSPNDSRLWLPPFYLLHPKAEIFSVIGHVFYLFTLSPPSFDSSFSSEKLLLHTTTAMSDTKRQRTQDGEKKVLPPFLFFSFFFPFCFFCFSFSFFFWLSHEISPCEWLEESADFSKRQERRRRS